MAQYQGLQGGLGNFIQSYMNNPFGNPFFQTQQQLGTRQAQNLGQQATSGLAQNQTASGLAGGASSPAGLEMLQNQMRSNTGLQSQLGFLNPVQSALGMQQFAAGLGSQYRPLQTGQTQTQSTSGLGTWLPQVAQLGLGALTGGASLPFTGMMMGGRGGGMPQSPFGSQGNIGSSGVPFAGAGGGYNWGGGGPSYGSPLSGWGAPTPPPPPTG